jgi:hypothetical protein
LRAALRRRRRRWRLSGTAGTAVAAMTTVTTMPAMTTRPAGSTGLAGSTRAEGPRHHRRTTGPPGAHTRGKWSTWEDRRPLARRRTFRPFGTEQAMVVVMMVMAGDRGAGEEDDRHHENDAGDDHDPRRDLVKPGRPRTVQMRWRRRCSCRIRLDRGFGYLGHVSIMPTHAPVIKHRRQQVTNDLSSQHCISAGCLRP